ncbi:MAG: phosphoribosylanthranilate isomerase [Cardiobacteriaceae bacterium]|nr:phosphoribosylanthranilate isomerase [Cardiobacteriaceae bacterium]
MNLSTSPMRVRVKICGLTRVEDVQAAVDAGADALGFVFHPPSPRHLSLTQAETLLAVVPPFVSTVALFADADAATVRQTLANLPLEQLQFHGAEIAAFCRQFGHRWFKAVPMRDLSNQESSARYIAAYPDSSAFLFDAFGRTQSGGSGKTFDWAQLPETLQPRIIAGGLHADNVSTVIQHYHPFAVDVSSGVESAPGLKSSAKMHRFIAAVRSAL